MTTTAPTLLEVSPDTIIDRITFIIDGRKETNELTAAEAIVYVKQVRPQWLSDITTTEAAQLVRTSLYGY